MPRKPQKKSTRLKSTPARRKTTSPGILEKNLTRFEFHRHALALMPEPADEDPGVAVRIDGDGPALELLNCNCAQSSKRTCRHVKQLVTLNRFLSLKLGDRSIAQDFKESIWHRIAATIAVGSGYTPQTVHSKAVSENGREVLNVYGSEDEHVLIYHSNGPDRARFAERCILNREDENTLTRAGILSQLMLWTLTDNERKMSERGFKTRRQALQEKFYYRLAYHAYREQGTDNFTIDTDVDPVQGTFWLKVQNREGKPVFQLAVPRTKVKALLECLKDCDHRYQGLEIHPVPLITVFKLSKTDGSKPTLEITPCIQLTLQSGKIQLWDEASIEKFRYGDLVYLAGPDVLADHPNPRRIPAGIGTLISGKIIIKKEEIPDFLDAFGADLSQGLFLPDASAKTLHIFRRPERITITPRTLERDWCWLSVDYGFGTSSLALSDILRARAESRRYIETRDGWLDAQAPEFDGLDLLLQSEQSTASEVKKNRLKISRLALLRLQASTTQELIVDGQKTLVNRLNCLLKFKPSVPLPKLKGLVSKLRTYQQLGAEWISFLYENGFGGLLCDDMGLGKTHEVMAFMVYLRRHRKIRKPFLVVCPTTVLSHWYEKIRDYAPGLRAVIYHGGLRNLDDALKAGDVIITSYGILRRDIRTLLKRAFGLVVFDEIQHIKNHLTQSYMAAIRIRGRMKLGLTGTPIENTLSELKALMDLVIPGYLGTDPAFNSRYVSPIEQNLKSPRRSELSRLVSPFTLRRLKATVLSELPPKIEDIRTCRLSEDQVKFYRDAVANRGHELIQLLRRPNQAVPYIHIFALLTLLKQICNHPATIENNYENYDQFQSGKWELFKELLGESLDSGQKVVVYSQYLNMIRIMEKYLDQNKVVYATLTGASRNRGKIIDRFNSDPDCRVFVGSLRAGGTGIDLVAASVVIHYDRWWNAAREDQATDRVHRIGQKRGVQVFKLVTEGTLEEKISAIIARKKKLMDGVVKEDDPGLLKTFSRSQLIALLAAPGAESIRD
ncbi:MAG: DEAD/DEAH box helicase [Desulfobacterales bacterium]|jgi:superfamily II DNA or RNA helicase